MKKIENFLNSDFYPLLIAILGFIAWSLPSDLLWLNNSIIILLLFLFIVLLFLFKNTKHVIPIALSLLFTVNMQNIGVKDVEGLGIFHLIAILTITGLVIHFIRFKHKFKFDWIALSLLLIAITYIIPMFYMPFTGLLFSISMSGFIYVLIYLFFRSTAEVKTDQVLTYFLYASMQLMAIMLYSMGKGFYELIQNNTFIETFEKGLRTSWGRGDYGFGNINDLIIHFTILSSGIFYRIIKRPKNYSYWLLALIAISVVLLSGSRGGFLSLMIVLFLYLIMIVVYGKRHQIIFTSMLILGFGALAYFYNDFVIVFYNNFINGQIDDLDAFSSGRIKLYKDALRVFKEYPLFGAGWTYAFEEGNVDRILIYHSTIFHTLAITGIAGMIAVFAFTISSFSTLLKKNNFNVLTLGIPWTASMIHGLIDNTIHMLVFTLITIIMFAAIQNEDNTTKIRQKEDLNFLMIDEFYK